MHIAIDQKSPHHTVGGFLRCALKGAVKFMCKKNNSSLFFVCSLIEQIGRTLHQKRGKVVSCLGTDRIRILLKNADILHCEPIAKVADDVVAEFGLQQDNYDNVGQSKYLVPDVWTIGKVYARLIEDISSDSNVAETFVEVYESWIDARLSDYNSVFYFQPREYIAESYRSGAMLED